MDADRLTLACATTAELRAARRAGARTALVGLGAANGVPEGALVSFGLAGALRDGLPAGTVLDATRVVDGEGSVLWEGEPLGVAGARPATILAGEEIVDGPEERRRLHELTGADVDLMIPHQANVRIIEATVHGLVAQGWHVKPVGALDLLPAETAQVLKDAAEATEATPGLLVNVAVGYGGRREIADAVRALLHDHATKGTSIEELAELLDVEHIADHLYTAGQPDPDLVIRTSGEQRLGGFLLWQSAHSEFYFCDAYWPAFRRVDFLRALRSYAARHRRFGS